MWFRFSNEKDHLKIKEDYVKLQILQLTLSLYITNKLDEWAVNEELMKSCIALSEDRDLNRVDASGVIMKELWRKLQETHKLRIVK